jgi:hypothetical protein
MWESRKDGILGKMDRASAIVGPHKLWSLEGYLDEYNQLESREPKDTSRPTAIMIYSRFGLLAAVPN